MGFSAKRTSGYGIADRLENVRIYYKNIAGEIEDLSQEQINNQEVDNETKMNDGFQLMDLFLKRLGFKIENEYSFKTSGSLKEGKNGFK